MKHIFKSIYLQIYDCNIRNAYIDKLGYIIDNDKDP